MYTQIFKHGLLIGGALSLGGCGFTEDHRGNEALVAAEQTAEKQAVDDGKIPCAVSGATIMMRVCQIEQAQTEQGLVLTMRHPDGGFRRLQVVKDGRGVIAADGADQAKVTVLGNHEIEVVLSGDRYRLPAKIKGASAAGTAAAPAPAPVPAH
jgi:hypothetical protein